MKKTVMMTIRGKGGEGEEEGGEGEGGGRRRDGQTKN